MTTSGELVARARDRIRVDELDEGDDVEVGFERRLALEEPLRLTLSETWLTTDSVSALVVLIE